MGEPSSVTEAQPVGDAMACVGQLVGQLCDDSDGSGGFGEPLLDDDDTEADSDHAHSQHMGDCREAAVAADDAGSRERPPRSGRCGDFHKSAFEQCWILSMCQQNSVVESVLGISQ